NNYNSRGGCTAGTGPGCWGPTWQILLLPYIEQGNLYSAYNMSKTSQDPVNAPVVTTIVQGYICPAAQPKPVLVQANTQGWFMARGNYGANGGTGNDGAHSFGNAIWYANDPHRMGLMSARKQSFTLTGTTLAEVRDGTSNTVMVSEMIT